MKKFSISFLLLVLACSLGFAQQYRKPVKPVKNVILMIPDGTSIDVVSAARWYQILNNPDSKSLNIDPYMCGTVITFSSDAPIGDSAPTMSAYMTGMPQQAGNISIYPLASQGKDLVDVDSAKTYQPLATILEAAKYQKNKATGLVVTVEFPHATPAACASHYYNRNKYSVIAPQMAYNNLDVMFGGGNDYVSEDMRKHFSNTGTILIQDDVEAFRTSTGSEKMWALFGKKHQPNDLDRDPSKVPSLAEMTHLAIERLSKHEDGFFLMVEGSKVDWAAHANDAVGCITEFLAFDEAVGVAMDFAKKDGETAVVILPDHGNSGLTIGERNCKGYTKLSLADLFGTVSKYKKSAYGMEEVLRAHSPNQYKSLFKEYMDIDLTEQELKLLLSSKDMNVEDYMDVKHDKSLVGTIVDIMNSRTCFGFTTGGHTGEEVFLAAYHPQGDLPIGVNRNTEINQYLADLADLQTPLSDMTKEVYVKHQEVFAGMNYVIHDKESNFPVLIVKKGKNKLEIPAFKSVASLNGNPFDLKSVIVYVDKNETFYVPLELSEKLK
ncbi:alkaline phosphatase [Dysgonomonas sp. 520]|uniref:alkaline phosphatase n=1 Tax=Dysgonomonas sp. 520 TaxID=2302931 RepID=UPI0013D24263|nr:alkaline phosphatase [Dysgonomonas sp. 520]NDW09482.1 alkaline phosphatase [Dysgonomonas sp. 520]